MGRRRRRGFVSGCKPLHHWGIFFFPRAWAERERWRCFFPTPVEKRRKRSGAQHRRLDEGTTGSCTRQSLIDAVAHTNASVHACSTAAPSYRHRARVVQHSRGNWTAVAMETGETVADGRRCALGASDLPLLNIHTSCTHSTHALMLSCFVFFFFWTFKKPTGQNVQLLCGGAVCTGLTAIVF